MRHTSGDAPYGCPFSIGPLQPLNSRRLQALNMLFGLLSIALLSVAAAQSDALTPADQLATGTFAPKGSQELNSSIAPPTAALSPVRPVPRTNIRRQRPVKLCACLQSTSTTCRNTQLSQFPVANLTELPCRFPWAQSAAM